MIQQTGTPPTSGKYSTVYYPQTEDDSADRDATDISKYCTVHTRTLYVLSKNSTVTKFVPLHVDPEAPPRQLHFVPILVLNVQKILTV